MQETSDAPTEGTGMSRRTVMNLIENAPTAFNDYQAAWKKHFNAAEKVLETHIESPQYELTTRQRSILRDRLVQAAVVVNHLIATAADAGRTDQLTANTELYGQIAKELQMTADELTGLVLQRY